MSDKLPDLYVAQNEPQTSAQNFKGQQQPPNTVLINNQKNDILQKKAQQNINQGGFVSNNQYNNQQQGYPPNHLTNQHYYNIPPSQPMIYSPQPQPILSNQHPLQPTVLVIQKNNRVGKCQLCNSNVGVLQNKRCGCATWSWCVCLFIFTGICCFWIPFVIDDCYDIEYRCLNCQGIRGKLKSQYGC